MQVMFACLADHASAEQQSGKLNVMGIFDNIGAVAFPARHPQMVLVIRILSEHEDNFREGKVQIVLRDSDNGESGKLELTFKAGAVPPGAFAASNMIVNIQQIVFARPGRYYFAIRVGEQDEVRVPLLLIERK